MKNIKGLLAVLTFMMISSCSAYALSFGDVFSDIRDNTKFKILSEGQPSYFYNMKDNMNEAAFTFPISSYRDIITADVGWASGYDDKTVGTVLAGGQLHADTLLPLISPSVAAFVKSILPEAVRNRTQNLRFGAVGGYNFSENDWKYGFIAGYAFGG